MDELRGSAAAAPPVRDGRMSVLPSAEQHCGEATVALGEGDRIVQSPCYGEP